MNTVTIYQGHVLDKIKELPDNSIHCIITSPPYFGPRNYDLDPVIWGDNVHTQSCKHDWVYKTRTRRINDVKPGKKQSTNKGSLYRDIPVPYADCQICGAWLGCLGLEPTVELYVSHIVDVCRELRRVLRKDGVFFLNIGDNYANKKIPSLALKPKDLYGIPWRVALALQADGWWLRCDIIWKKRNAMPESILDRPVREHEYIFMFTKDSHSFWDHVAVREKGSDKLPWGGRPLGKLNSELAQGRHGKTFIHRAMSREERMKWHGRGHNLRSVWDIPTKSFAGEHYASFPTDLAEVCIKAGTSEKGCCPICGSPWQRVLIKIDDRHWTQRRGSGVKWAMGMGHGRGDGGHSFVQNMIPTSDWKPSCNCMIENSISNPDFGEVTSHYIPDPIPCTVLDPFFGSGTVGVSSLKLGRNCIGIELGTQYIKMAKDRIDKLFGLVADIRVVVE